MLIALMIAPPAPAPARQPAAPDTHHPWPAPRSRIALGAAAWWGCIHRAFQGPPELACRRPYDPRYEQRLREHFDVVVAENELKMPWIHPSPSVYDFRAADQLAAWAQAHGKHMRGHTLIWGKALPRWITEPLPDLRWTRTRLLREIKSHIRHVMGHFRERYPGVIRQWDVVNEAFTDDGGLHDNLLLRVIGPDYIEKAFQYARQADPDALLFYNEYQADRPNARSQAVIDMAHDFRRRHIPLDGIGLQMHITTQDHPTPHQLRQLLRAYARLGLRAELTELDITTTPTSISDTPTQAQLYHAIFTTCRTEPNCTGITVWGVADPYSWRGPLAKPLLFDDDLNPKPYLPELTALLQPPRTPRRQRPREHQSDRHPGDRGA